MFAVYYCYKCIVIGGNVTSQWCTKSPQCSQCIIVTNIHAVGNWNVTSQWYTKSPQCLQFIIVTNIHVGENVTSQWHTKSPQFLQFIIIVTSINVCYWLKWNLSMMYKKPTMFTVYYCWKYKCVVICGNVTQWYTNKQLRSQAVWSTAGPTPPITCMTLIENKLKNGLVALVFLH